MTDQKYDKDEIEEAKSTDAVNNGRRGFVLKGVVAAVPVVMASVTRPAWGDLTGTPMRCGSAIISGNVSQDIELRCQGGYSPGRWKNRVDEWPVAVLPGAPFCGSGGTFMGCTSNDSPGYDYTGKTLEQVMTTTGPSGFNGSFGWHAIATLLNSYEFSNYVFSPTLALSIINQVLTTGFYVDSMGVSHNAQQVKTMFDSTY